MIQTPHCNPADVRVTLLKGGVSSEREVSLRSGEASAKALREQGFVVTEVDTGEPTMIQQILDSKPDVVFNVLHGKDGEDGCIQGFLELVGIPYTGSGVLASALAMDKSKSKVFYEQSGIDTPGSITLIKGHPFDIDEVIAKVGEKSVVKPAGEGSSVGMSIVHNEKQLAPAIEKAFECDETVLVESFIQGVEVTVAVLGNEHPQALPVIEIVPWDKSEFYDFEAKYAAGGSTHIIPARISDELTATCQRQAVAAHKVLGCRGVSRTDFIIDEEGVCWALETNTLPGMTATSLLPDAAAKAGIEFGPLCQTLVELALEK